MVDQTTLVLARAHLTRCEVELELALANVERIKLELVLASHAIDARVQALETAKAKVRGIARKLNGETTGEEQIETP